MLDNTGVKESMKIRLDGPLPEPEAFCEGIRRAPDRGCRLTQNQTAVALKNALRYIPEEYHEVMRCCSPSFSKSCVPAAGFMAIGFGPMG